MAASWKKRIIISGTMALTFNFALSINLSKNRLICLCQTLLVKCIQVSNRMILTSVNAKNSPTPPAELKA